MELWQMDVVCGVLPEGGQDAKILTGIDDRSRVIVCVGIVARATLMPDCAAPRQRPRALRTTGVALERHSRCLATHNLLRGLKKKAESRERS
jgi:hypothetical protein